MSNKKQNGRADYPSNTPNYNTVDVSNHKDKNPYAINGYKFSELIFDYSYENYDVKPRHISLLHFLVDTANRCGWKPVLEIESMQTKSATGIYSTNSLMATYRDIANWGFIKIHQKPKNQHVPALIELRRTINCKAINKALHRAILQQCKSVGYSKDEAEFPYFRNEEGFGNIINIESIQINNKKTVKMELHFHPNELRNLNDMKSTAQEKIKTNLEKILNDNFDLLATEDLTQSSYKILLNNDQGAAPTIHKENSSNLENEILDYFGISELNNFRLFKKVRDFLYFLGDSQSIFVENFTYYQKYKEITGEHIHSLEKFLGSPEESYQDGAWCSINYKNKLKQFEKNQSNPQEKSRNDLNQGRIDVVNRFLNDNDNE